MIDTIRRYVPKAEARALIDELKPASEEEPGTKPTNGEAAKGEQPPPKTD
jgi:hypothetical protein